MVGWVCIGTCVGAGDTKGMYSGGIYLELLNCSHFVNKVMN